MQRLFLKALNVVTYILNPHIPFKYSFFIRDNYFSRMVQAKYLLKDHFLKQPYKKIEFFGEFQQELTFVLPFAYWHHLNGTLLQTTSCNGTSPFYFFSEKHIEVPERRDWLNNSSDFEVPNMEHSNSFSYKKWARVPLKEHYANERFVFDKPILVIANKYNIEWQGDPINYFSVDMLDGLFSAYKNKYQIVYNRPLSTYIVGDESEILDLGEFDLIRADHPEVILLNDLHEKHKESYSFNQLQLMVYANASKFISVHGGTAALASYFGGTNIIFSKRGLEHIFNEFGLIFPKLSGAKILHAKDEAALLRFAAENL